MKRSGRRSRMENENIYRFLGLAQRAGRVLSGNDQLRDGIKNKKGTLVLLAEDASERTAKEIRAMAETAGISLMVFGEKEKLGQALGKGGRAALLLTDSGFAKAVRKKIEAGRKEALDAEV